MHFHRQATDHLKRAGAPVDSWGELVLRTRDEAESAAVVLAEIHVHIGAAELGALSTLHQMQHLLLRKVVPLVESATLASEAERLLDINPSERDGRRASEEAVLLVALAENPHASPLSLALPDTTNLRSLLLRQDEWGERLSEVTLLERSEGGSQSQDALRIPTEALRIAFVHRDVSTSLEAQIDHLLHHFGDALATSPDFHAWLDLRFALSEEQRWHARNDEIVRGPSHVLRFTERPPGAAPVRSEGDRRFSADLSWMPRVVLIAKSVYVWLAQLSAEFGRPLSKLSDIPDEVLRGLASRGFTALWLIGIWRRSAASATIKEKQGIGDAIASAYSIDSYAIDERLGGHEAYEDLRARSALHGIRLAADLVPNHMGIDSEWVRERPDYFVQTDTCPYPGYRFSVDVSSHAEVGTYIEDGYFHRSDAAVVFKRVDHRTGQESFIYHGNDGTSMPWNDTAQLDYTKPQVRAAMLDLIVRVAKMFPILRFDAAMTLAKQHYQRLWFPAYGSGEAIASRGRFAMSQADFDRVMPEEFWREVVARVAADAPDTLLLAEAFWMMEGYFVRSLGMHRVYNSAFMNMFKAEENEKYHQLIANVVEYDPEILGRFVNFMNNPDEEPAAVQFGTTDKYFAVCTLLATLPGTPMFGHGQFEGFREKYGMEFYRPRQDERVDEGLFHAHEAMIVPLLRERAVFAQAKSFRLFPFQGDHGVNPNVFAFYNEGGGRAALVLVHNRYASTRGTISQSIVSRKDNGELSRESLVEVLFGGRDCLTLVHATHQHEWTIARSEVERDGLSIDLGPYAHDVWWIEDPTTSAHRRREDLPRGSGPNDRVES